MFIKKHSVRKIGNVTKEKYFVKNHQCLGMTCLELDTILTTDVAKFPVYNRSNEKVRTIKTCKHRFTNCPCGEYSQELADERSKDWVITII